MTTVINRSVCLSLILSGQHGTSFIVGSLADNSVAAEHISDGFPQQEVRLTACRPKRQVARPREAQLFYKANIPDVMLQNIMSLQQDYDRHLRLTATHPSGNFNPWKLVERYNKCITQFN